MRARDKSIGHWLRRTWPWLVGGALFGLGLGWLETTGVVPKIPLEQRPVWMWIGFGVVVLSSILSPIVLAKARTDVWSRIRRWYIPAMAIPPLAYLIGWWVFTTD